MRGAAFLAASVLALVAATEPDPKTETEHLVRSGETLSGIAKRADVPRVLIIEVNGLKPPYVVKSGQKLLIPRRRDHVVGKGETSFGIAMDYGVPWSTIAAANGLDPKAKIKPGQKLTIPTVSRLPSVPEPAPAPSPTVASTSSPSTPAPIPLAATPPTRFSWPVPGEIRRGFVGRKGKASYHDGIDILADDGKAVRASAAGTVIFAGDGPPEYGKTVIIHHGGRWTTTYSYLGKITVKDGQKVKAGQKIGKVGHTGLATEPQLHYEIRRNRVALDPEVYLPAPEDQTR